jgi:cysteine desulfuration protein SufE
MISPMPMTPESPSSRLTAKAEELKETFDLLPNAEERLMHLMNLGKRYPAMLEEYRVEENLLAGCISRLWVKPELRDGHALFHMDAEALISKGVAALICDFYKDATPSEILAFDQQALAQSGVAQLLSPSRQSGLSSMLRTIHAFAQKAQA